mgnify:CR=1 FL=1
MKGKISLAGDLGSGKSTVSDILTKQLGATYYSTGAIVRSIAKSYGMGVEEFNRYMKIQKDTARLSTKNVSAMAKQQQILLDLKVPSTFCYNLYRVKTKVTAIITHDKLLELNGEYSMLYHAQFER